MYPVNEERYRIVELYEIEENFWETVQELTVMICKAETKVLTLNYEEIGVLQNFEVCNSVTMEKHKEYKALSIQNETFNYLQCHQTEVLNHIKATEVIVLEIENQYFWDQELDTLHLGYSHKIPVTPSLVGKKVGLNTTPYPMGIFLN